MIDRTSEQLTQPLEMTGAGADWHRPASVGLELPGLDSNQDKENQNLHTPRRKPKPHKTVTPGAVLGCSAGCSDQRNEGGIPDPALAALIAAWPALPDPIKAGILAMIRAASG
jgi:hypothetical protein